MSTIDEQVKKLREYATYIGNCAGAPFGSRKILEDAANTIESLSAKLEESKWIFCSDHLPEEPEVSPYDTIRDQIREGLLQEYIVMIYGAAKPTTLWYVGSEKWYDPYTEQNYIVTKWMPLPTCLSNQAAVQKGGNP